MTCLKEVVAKLPWLDVRGAHVLAMERPLEVEERRVTLGIVCPTSREQCLLHAWVPTRHDEHLSIVILNARVAQLLSQFERSTYLVGSSLYVCSHRVPAPADGGGPSRSTRYLDVLVCVPTAVTFILSLRSTQQASGGMATWTMSNRKLLPLTLRTEWRSLEQSPGQEVSSMGQSS